MPCGRKRPRRMEIVPLRFNLKEVRRKASFGDIFAIKKMTRHRAKKN